MEQVMQALGHAPETPPQPPATVAELHERFGMLAEVFRQNGEQEG
jgi:hypothetical protein